NSGHHARHRDCALGAGSQVDTFHKNKPYSGGRFRKGVHLRTGTVWLLVLSAPKAAQACAVCFGGANSDLSRGFFWGMLLLLLLPFTLVGLFIGAIVRSSRKEKGARS